MKHKSTRIPRIFRKTYREKALHRKILRRVHIPGDRAFLEGLFRKTSSGRMELAPDLPPETAARLKPLSKVIRKNRGFVSRWKGGILLVLAAGVLVFSLFFKDRLAERGMETALEKVFRARAEVTGLHIAPLSGEFSFTALTVADRENPLVNLFETGPSVFSIRTADLLYRRLRIEEMSVTEIRTGTPRADDGSLAPAEPEETGDSGMDAGSLIPTAADFNADNLIEKEMEALRSPALYARSTAEWESFTVRWEETYREKEASVQELTDSAKALTSLSREDLSTPRAIADAAARARELKTSIAGTREEIRDLNSRFRSEKERLESLRKEAEEAAEADREYLASRLDLSPDNLKSIASQAAETYIRNRWEGVYRAASRIREILTARKEKAPDSEEETLPRRSRGRDFPFSPAEEPAFLLEKLLLSGETARGSRMEGEIRNLTTEPEVSGRVISLRGNLSGPESRGQAEGQWDPRPDAPEALTLAMSASGLRADLEEGIPALGIRSLSSRAALEGELRSRPDGSTQETGLRIRLSDMAILQEDSAGILALKAGEILAGLDSADLTATLVTGPGGLESLNVRTGLDDIISRELSSLLEARAAEQRAALEDRLEEILAPYRGETLLGSTRAEGIETGALDEISSLDDLEGSVDTFIQEKTATLEQGLKDKAGEEASALMEGAAQKLKIPGF